MDRPPRMEREPRAAPELDMAVLAEVSSLYRFTRGTELAVQGEPCSSLHILRQGQVLLSRQNPEGESYALSLLGPGDLFGEGSLRPAGCWMASARAVTDGSVYVVPTAQVPRLAQFYPQLVTQLLRLMSGRLEQAHRRLDLFATTSARERVIGLLRVMAGSRGEIRGEELWLPLPLTQAELGGLLGLTRETVTRVIAELEAEGILRHIGRRGFSILSRTFLDSPGAAAFLSGVVPLACASQLARLL